MWWRVVVGVRVLGLLVVLPLAVAQVALGLAPDFLLRLAMTTRSPSVVVAMVAQAPVQTAQRAATPYLALSPARVADMAV